MHVGLPAGEGATACNRSLAVDIKGEPAGLDVDRDVLDEYIVGALVAAAQENVHRSIVFEKPRLGNFPAHILLVIRREFIFLAALLSVVNRNSVKGMLRFPDRRRT